MSDGNVIELFPGALDYEDPPEEGTPAPDVAKTLRELADMAERGAFQSFAFVAVSPDRTRPIIDSSALDLNPYVLLAGLDEIMTILRDINISDAEMSARPIPPTA